MVALFDTPNTTEQDATLAEVKKLYEHAGWIVDIERKKKPCEMLVMVGLQEKPETPAQPKQAPYRVVVSIPHSVMDYDCDDLNEAEGRCLKEKRGLRDELEDVGSVWIEKLSPAGIYEKVQP